MLNINLVFNFIFKIKNEIYNCKYIINMMDEKDSCFICLEETSERICNICKCYCHKKCFNEYINKNFKIIGEIVFSNYYIDLSIYGQLLCPICKINLKYNKILTRSNTFYFRNKFLLDVLEYYILLLDSEEDIYKCQKYLDKICKILVQNKDIIKKNKILAYMVEKNLSKLKDEWKPSNIYYYQIFDKQII